MRHSEQRILVSHAGNLPRPPDVEALVAAKDTEGFERRLPSAVQEVVDRQIDCGVDVVNDGEYVKAAGNFATYIEDRITGWEALPATRPPKRAGVGERDRRDFPGFYASGLWLSGSGGPIRPGFATPGAARPEPTTQSVCTSPIRYTGQEQIKHDVANLKAAIAGKEVEGFVAALGPISFGAGRHNEYYPSEEAYLSAVADAVREEYKAIVDGGLIVQLDEPNFFTAWMFYPDYSVDEYRKLLEFYVEIINYALDGLPEEQIRFHACWGSGHRPHVHDIELKYIADLLIKINAQSYSIEAANVRHAHEWRVWQDVKLPDGRILMPGVISHATDLVEHPELVAERLVNFASVVGKNNLQTGTDCGIGSRVGHEEIVWAKLKAMSEGARLASERLWA
jgi:5-methyltetrahydropteroyltriglutamate--homocysteine methyltransferase